MKKCVWCDSVFEDRFLDCPGCGRSKYRLVPSNTPPAINKPISATNPEIHNKNFTLISRAKQDLYSEIRNMTAQPQKSFDPYKIKNLILSYIDQEGQNKLSMKRSPLRIDFRILTAPEVLIGLLSEKKETRYSKIKDWQYKFADFDDRHILESFYLDVTMNVTSNSVRFVLNYEQKSIAEFEFKEIFPFQMLYLSIDNYSLLRDMIQSSFLESLNTASYKIEKFKYHPSQFLYYELLSNIRVRLQSITFILLSGKENSIDVIPCLTSEKLSRNISFETTKYSLRRHKFLNALNQFEYLLNNNSNEREFHNFFIENPYFLLGEHYSDLRSEVPLICGQEHSQDMHILKPDFLVRETGYNTWDILDLKLPSDKIIVGPMRRRRLASKVQSAIAQLKEYRRFFEAPDNRKKILQEWDILVTNPKLILVIGRSFNIDEPDLLNEIRNSLGNIVLYTYGDLLERAKRSFSVFNLP